MHNNDQEVIAPGFLLEHTSTNEPRPSAQFGLRMLSATPGDRCPFLGEPRDNNSLDQAASTQSRKVSVFIFIPTSLRIPLPNSVD